MVVFADRTDRTDRTDSESSSTPAERRARLYESPPSAKLVYAVLEASPELTQSQIAERSRLSKRTTRHALSTLTDEALVEARVSLRDARVRIYEPLPVTVPDGGRDTGADRSGATASDASSAPEAGPALASGDEGGSTSGHSASRTSSGSESTTEP